MMESSEPDGAAASGATCVTARLPPSRTPNLIAPMRRIGASMVCRLAQLAFANREVPLADPLRLELPRDAAR